MEGRNKLDGLVYATEKTFEEHKDKLDAEPRAALETAIADAKKALEGEDAEAMERAGAQLEQASHKLAEAMYRQAPGAGGQAGPGSGGPGGGGAASGGSGGPGAGEDVIDAEYVDVDKSSN